MADYIFRVKNGIAVNTNLIYATAGQVGFNTTTPDANVTIVGTANVQGAFSVTGTSAHTLASSFANAVTVTGAVTLSNTISVTGAATLSSTLSVTGTSGYTGAATFSNTVSVTGGLTLSNNLTVAGQTTLQSLIVNATSAAILTAGSNTGTLYLGNTFARALVYDGTQYSFPNAQLYINGSLALHAANYSSYVNSISPTLTGSGASGNWAINVTGTSTNITAYTVNQNLGTTSSPQFNALTLAAGDLTLQRSGAPTTGLIFFGNAGTRYLYWDGSNYSFLGATGANIFINGYVVLNAANYNSYSPTLTGGNASGTWGINITGNAATVSNGVYNNGGTYGINISGTAAAASS